MIKMENMLSAETFNDASTPNFTNSKDAFTICSKENQHYSAGMYTAEYNMENANGKLLNIVVPYTCSGKKISPRVMVSFADCDGKLIQSDYFVKYGNEFVLKTEIPQGSKTVKLEMLMYCFGKGEVTYGHPHIEICPKTPHRVVRVASAFIERKGNFADNYQNILSVIEEAGNSAEKPDILCFTECVLDLSCPEKYYIDENSEEYITVCSMAKKYGMYIIFTSHEKDSDGYLYNTSFLISDKGESVGKYRKVFLTGMGELKGGLTPGEEFPVFDTPIGKIGMLTCWDGWFPEGARELAKKGAEMIFWSTRGFHEERPVTRAMDNGIYCIVSHSNPKNCGIIEPAWGKYLARADGSKEQGFVSALIDLDERLISQYKSFGRNGSNDRDMFVAECSLY